MALTVLPVALSFPVALALGLGLAAILAVIAVIDLRTLRIPDGLSLPLTAIGLALAVAVPGVAAVHHVVGAAVGYLVLAGVGEVYFRRRRVEGLGLGDAKLFAAAGAWLGWAALPQVLLMAAVGGLLQAVLLRRPARDAPLAFGPWLAFGFLATWMAMVVAGAI